MRRLLSFAVVSLFCLSLAAALAAEEQKKEAPPKPRPTPA